jgi:hypothetical protein
MKRTLLTSLALAAVLVACGGADDSASTGGGGAGGGVFSATMADETSTPANGSKVVVIWSVSSGSPDYAYSFGQGGQNGGQVSIAFPSVPPPEALNRENLGVGLIALVDANLDIPAGKLSGKIDARAIRAISADHAIIYRGKNEPYTRGGWDASFPSGFACGKCVPKPADATTPFDSFVIEDCAKVVLKPAGSRICNWT